MIRLLRRFQSTVSGIDSINNKIFCIIFLNFIDGILTYIGVTNNYTVEINKIIVNVVSNINKLLIFKLFIPTLVLLAVAYIINKKEYRKMPVACFFINICFFVYLFVLLTHFIWIGMVVFTAFSPG